MNTVEIKSLLPATSEQLKNVPVEINSNNVFLYLLGGPNRFEKRRPRFASYLDLGSCSGFFEELEQETKEDYIFSEELRKPIGKAQREDDFWETKAAVERARIVYYDWGEEKIKATPIEHGEHTTVPISINVLSTGNILIIGHTHSGRNPSLPSPIDYAPLLLGVNDERLSHAITVIEDQAEAQLLALATPDTPYFRTLEEVERYIRDFEVYDKTNEIVNRQKQIVGIGVKVINEIYIEALRKVDERLKRGEDPDIDTLRKETELKASGVTAVAKRAADINAHRFGRYVKKTSNDITVAFARTINAQLYASENMRDFYKINI